MSMFVFRPKSYANNTLLLPCFEISTFPGTYPPTHFHIFIRQAGILKHDVPIIYRHQEVMGPYYKHPWRIFANARQEGQPKKHTCSYNPTLTWKTHVTPMSYRRSRLIFVSRHGATRVGGGSSGVLRKKGSAPAENIHPYNPQNKNTYNTRNSLVVTHPTTSLAVTCLSMGERTGSRVLKCLWSYVKVWGGLGEHIANHSALQFLDLFQVRASCQRIEGVESYTLGLGLFYKWYYWCGYGPLTKRGGSLKGASQFPRPVLQRPLSSIIIRLIPPHPVRTTQIYNTSPFGVP